MAAPDPPYLRLLKGESWPMNMEFMRNYQAKYFNTSRFRPVMHVIGFVMVLGYCLEYPHLKHEKHSAQRKRALEGGH